jgi:hypothetical protein
MLIGYFIRAILKVRDDVHGGNSRQLTDWEDNTQGQNAIFVISAMGLVLFAGCMSGLTLGLMSLDIVELEVREKLRYKWSRFVVSCLPSSDAGT